MEISGKKWGIMFKGVSDITIDNKGRATMPQRYRKDFYEKRKSSLIITADKDQCLLIYPLTIWNDVERQLLQLPSYSNEARFLQRLVLGFATETELDNQGRFLIPNPLRKYAKISKKIILLGQGKKFELWSEDVWSSKFSSWLKTEGRKNIENSGIENLII